MRLYRRILRTAAGLGLLTWSVRAEATYSVTAFDRTTRAFGAAGASCVPYPVDIIFGVVPGAGVLNMQAALDASLKETALSMLRSGYGAEEVLVAVTDTSVQAQANRFQWGIIDISGSAVVWTGQDAVPIAGHLAWDDARFVATFQGNLMSSMRVIEQARAAFAEPGCDLADKLMAALEGALRDGEGDRRCTAEGRPANSAYLHVSWSSGETLHWSIPDVSPNDPTSVLRARYDAWRSMNPCPAPAATPGGESSNGCSMRARDLVPRAAARAHSPAPWLPLGLSLGALAAVKRCRRRLSRAPDGRSTPRKSRAELEGERL